MINFMVEIGRVYEFYEFFVIFGRFFQQLLRKTNDV